jgi:hypothetical protein
MEQDLDDSRRCTVSLPADAGEEFDVYVNGVLQEEDRDYEVDGGTLIFHRLLVKDRVSRWRWALGAWGVGTYRQDDTVDITYDVDGVSQIAHAVPIRPLGS